MGRAVLSIYDPVDERVVDMEVTWTRGFDTDAKMQVPVRFKKLWAFAVKLLRAEYRDQPLHPYPTLPISIKGDRITKSASGFFVIAEEIWSGVGWRVSPPYPEVEEIPEGVTP